MARADRTHESPAALGNPPAKRYTVTPSGERVLIGLTAEETREFEQMARERSHGLQDAHGRRWFSLYTKHEQSWQRHRAEAAQRNKR